MPRHSRTDSAFVGCVLIAILLAALGLYGLFALYESDRTIQGRTVPCVGVTEDSLRDSTLQYEISTRNAIVGVVTIETLIVPAIVVFKDFYCPVDVRS